MKKRLWPVVLLLLSIASSLPARTTVANDGGDFNMSLPGLTVILRPATAPEGGRPQQTPTPPPTPVRMPVTPAAPQHEVENLPPSLEMPTPVGRPLPGDAIDLKLLVVSADGQESDFEAITDTLDRLGVRYDTLIATRERLTEPQLWRGTHAAYHGVILATGNLSYWNPNTRRWESAFNPEEWQLLWRYEARFGIRQVTWFTYPGGLPDDYGLALEGGLDTTEAPLQVSLTDAGRRVFWYLNPATPIGLNYTWLYLAHPVDANTTPLLQAPGGYTVAALRRYADGRENLALTMAHNPNLTHSLLLGYGLVNWVSRGLFLGERHVYLNPQVDDIFIRDKIWDTRRRSDDTGKFYRLKQVDIQALLNWQERIHTQVRNAAEVELELAFNGEGAADPPRNDTLLPSLVPHQARFRWVNHTFGHQVMDESSYDLGVAEIQRNHEMAQQLGLTRYWSDSLVTPEVSGLNNPDFMRAARDAGIRYLVSDTSRPQWNNPAPNTGIYSQLQPEILIIPRHPNNLFFNVSTPSEWVSEYNYLYRRFWKRNLKLAEIIDKESDILLQYLLKFDIDPLMFHQSNLRSYDGTHSLLTDLLDKVLARYNALFQDLPIRSLSMHAVGDLMKRRAIYNSATIQATLVRGKGLSLTADRDVVVPVTGAQVGGSAEYYAGQVISSVTLRANEKYWLPLEALVGYEP